MSALESKFLVFEGIEGAGKSTIIRHLKQLLERYNCDVVVTREPGGTPMANNIRSLLLKSGDEVMHPHTELCLMTASRSQHVQEVIKPAIAQNKWILCDRFCDSSVAYQGYGRGIDREVIRAINHFACDGVKADITILCDLSPDIALERIKRRAKDRIESEKIEFFEKIRNGYLEMAEADESYHVVDASLGLTDVLDSIYGHLKLIEDPR